MKVKRGWWLFVAVTVVLIVLGDVGLARHQEEALREEFRGGNVIGSFADRVKPGMARPLVEALIKGYRQYSIFDSGDEITCTYRYWFGFIPPVRGLRYKTVGSLRVTYGRDGTVISSSYWMR